MLAPVLATFTLVTSVLVPVLDAGERHVGAILESEHDPATCVWGHDHGLCTQVGASRSLTSEPPRFAAGPSDRRETTPPVTYGITLRTSPFLPIGSRAPRTA